MEVLLPPANFGIVEVNTRYTTIAKFNMRIPPAVALFAVFNHALAAPAPGNAQNLQELAVPAACATPFTVLVAYEVLNSLKATSFCTE